MTQTIQYDKNPSGEGAAARVSRAAATPTISTDTGTGWPALGSKSHKAVATAVTICTTGLPNADRPAAAAGELWSTQVTVRALQACTIQAGLAFYGTLGATLGTLRGTVTSAAVTFAAGEVKTLTIDGALAPALTASVDLQVSRTIAGAPAIGDAFYVDKVTLTKTATSVPYRDPTTSPAAVWSGTADASTQVYYDPTVTVVPYEDDAPTPRVDITLTDLYPSALTVTVRQISAEGTVNVRDAIRKPDTANAFFVTDYAVPPGIPVTYQAQQYSATGAELGLTGTATTQVNFADPSTVVIQDPLNAKNSVRVEAKSDFGGLVARKRDVQLYRRGSDTIALMGQMGLLEGVPLPVQTKTIADAEKLTKVLAVSQVLVRSMPGYLRIPRCLHVVVGAPVESPVDVSWGGTWSVWPIVGDEVTPSEINSIASPLTYTRFKATYATYTAAKLVYSTYLQAKQSPPPDI